MQLVAPGAGATRLAGVGGAVAAGVMGARADGLALYDLAIARPSAVPAAFDLVGNVR
jgi:hypothetical protein